MLFRAILFSFIHTYLKVVNLLQIIFLKILVLLVVFYFWQFLARFTSGSGGVVTNVINVRLKINDTVVIFYT